MFTLKPVDGIVPIVQTGDPVLRLPARPLTAEQVRSREIRDLIEVMRRTMHGAPGVGLAAPQIGLNLQIAVIEDKPEYIRDASPEFIQEREREAVPFHAIINPVLTPVGSERREFYEGCLSVQGFTGIVERARQVRVECLDARGKPKIIEASGWYARILQHEIDHLNGTLYIDRMKTRSFCSLALFDAHYKGKSVNEVRKMLGEI